MRQSHECEDYCIDKIHRKEGTGDCRVSASVLRPDRLSVVRGPRRIRADIALHPRQAEPSSERTLSTLKPPMHGRSLKNVWKRSAFPYETLK